MTDLELITAKDVCGLLKINPSTLWRWVKAGRFPAPLVIGPNCTRWSRIGVGDWLGQHSGQQLPCGWERRDATGCTAEMLMRQRLT